MLLHHRKSHSLRWLSWGLTMAVAATAWNVAMAATPTPPEVQMLPQSLPDPRQLPHRRAVPKSDHFKHVPSLVGESWYSGHREQPPPSSGDLSETIDVQLSPATKELAESLGGKVTNIFNWTRSNIAFTPTFGSIQGSEGCRLSRECNAHDTASLLIALLRAAHIPARYVLGEVSLDPDFFRSVVGDFDDLQAAGRFAASSGTPTTFVVDPDQKVVAVRLAHVWVEAYVSDEKSKHAEWVALDAALKKIDFRPPVNAEETLELSAAPFEEILAAATFDANRDSVTNIDAAAIDQEVRGLQDHLQGFLDCCTTVGEITGFLQLPEPTVVNELVTFEPLQSAFETTSDTAGCPAGFVGTFSFEARLTNNSSSPPLAELVVQVNTLTNGNLLHNADGGPGGVGARLTVPQEDGFVDGVLSPAEFVDVPFMICLQQQAPFQFLVDVLGEAKVGEVKTIEQLRKEFPGTIVQAEAGIAELPAAVRHLLTLQLAELSGMQVITISRTLPELVNRRLTVAYFPATQADVDFIEANGGLYTAPPTGFQVRPVVMLDGEIVAAGAPVPMGVFQQLRLTFREVGDFSDFVDHFITAGTYAIVGLNFQRVGSESLIERRARLATALEGVRSGSGVNLDEVLGEALHDQAQIYYALLDIHTRLSAHKLNVMFGRRPAELLMSFAPVFTFDENGIPMATQSGSLVMDFRRNILSVASRTGRTEDEGNWFFGIGAYSSALEHSIFEITQDTASVSTLRLIHTANDQGIPIFAIDARNLARVLPQLNLPDFVIDMIVDAVAVGNFVITPRDEVQFLQWRGVGFIIIDPVTAAGGYLIAGNLAPAPSASGGATAENSPATERTRDILVTSSSVRVEPDPETGLPMLIFENFTNPTNASSVEGLILSIDREVEVTATDAAVFEAPARIITSLPTCAQAILAQEESGAIHNRLLWNNLFGSPAGIPSARIHVPTLSAFVFDSLQEELEELRTAAPDCE